MDPRDGLRQVPDGATCTACGAPVPTGLIRILARRADVAFVELACPACGSSSIGLLIPADSPDDAPVLDIAADASAFGRATRRETTRPISEADVETIRADLAAWEGDLVGWLEALDRGRSVVDR
jgi:hypothetical protein